MKLARIHGPGDLRLDDVPEPQVGPEDVILSVGACGICGSDVGYAKIGGVQGPADSPMPIGHELAGTVAEVGSQVHGIAVGDRVALNPGAAGFGLGNGGPEGGFARHLLIRGAAQGKSLFKIPDAMPFEIAALAEPLGVGMHAVNQVNAQSGDQVVVLGGGPIGLSAAATLLDRGIDEVVVADLSATRLQVARDLGVKHTVHVAEEDLWESLGQIHGRQVYYGADVVNSSVYIEATGSGPLLEDVIHRCAPGARISVVALHRKPVSVSFMIVLMKQLMLQGSMEYPERYEDMLDLLGRRDLSPMITHRFGLDEFLEAFAIAQSPDAGAKVMIGMD